MTARLRPTSNALSSVWLMRPLLHVGKQVGEAARQALAARLERLRAAPPDWSPAKFAGHMRVDPLPRGEARALLRARLERRALDQLVEVARRRAGTTASGSCSTGSRATRCAAKRRSPGLGDATGSRSPAMQRASTAAPASRGSVALQRARLRRNRAPRLPATDQQPHPALRDLVASTARSPRGRHRETPGCMRAARFCAAQAAAVK